MQEAENTFCTFYTALTDAVKFFSEGVTSNGVPLTQQQAVDLLEVYNSLLSVEESEPHNVRAYIVRRSLECGLVRFLAGILTQPFQHVHEVDAQAPEKFLLFRIKAVASLQRLFTVCTNLGEHFSTYCFRVATEEDLLPQLLRTLSESPDEALRLSVAETLFLFLLCTRDGPVSLVASNGINILCSSLLGDISQTVRSVCASVLRELVNTYATEFTNPAVLSVLIKSFDDTCADVRTLVAEIIEQSLRLCAGKMLCILQESQNLLASLQRIFNQDAVVEVVVAAAHLMGTCCQVANEMRIHKFFVNVMATNFVKTLLSRLQDGDRTSSACAQTLRLLIQHAPAAYEFAWQVLQDNEQLAVFLKCIIDAGRGTNSAGEDLAVVESQGVELALCLAIILNQSPMYRKRLVKELEAYPQWTGSIKNAVLLLLNAISLDYFTNIQLQDVTGYHLNTLNGVVWNPDNTPQLKYVQQLFQQQTKRVSVLRNAVLPSDDVPGFLTADVHDGDTKELRGKKARLTFFMLAFATNITFQVVDREVMEVTAGEPPPSRPRAESNVTPKFPPSPMAYGRQHEPVCFLDSGVVSLPKRSGDKSNMLPEEKEAMIIAYDKFNSFMTFVMRYTKHYSETKQKMDDVVETDDGYVVKMSRLRNPWHVVVVNQRLNTWQVNDLKVGDLFYFSIPFDEIGVKAIDTVLYRARRHMVYLKKELVTTPQVRKGRRCFLSDMMKNVMPKALMHLEDLRALVQNHGKEGVRFPIFLFREKELHFGERALHPGNLIEVIDQIEFYYSQSTKELVGVDNARLLGLAKQLDEVERGANIGDIPGFRLSCITHEANSEQNVDDNGYGHGTISSDSETDF